MSDMTIPLAISRIATTETPLAAFKSNDPDKINIVFAETIHTMQLISIPDLNYIGTYNKDTVDQFKSDIRHLGL